MTKKNRFGLSRSIPNDVALAVRQHCGFGCVLCGASIVQYDHFDPPFAEARFHDPSKIALLCASCHDNVTRGYWSHEKVAAAMEHPHCRSSGFSWGAFDFGALSPSIRLAGVTLTNCPIPIAIDGKPLFTIKGPEAPGGPFRLSGEFYDLRGRSVCKIIENIWQLRATTWDVECIGGRIAIKDQGGAAALVLVAEPPHCLRVESLRMSIRGRDLIGDGNTLIIRRQYGNQMVLTGCIADNCPIGLSV